MKPESFDEQNAVFAKDQPEYLPLPAHRTKDGEVISAWRLSLKERLILLFTGRMWLRVFTFNTRLQPLLLQVESPFVPSKPA